MQRHRAHVEALFLDVGGGVLPFLALNGGLAHHEQRGCAARQVEQVAQFGQSFEGVEVRLDGHQHQVGTPGGLDGIGSGVGRRIDHDEIHALPLGVCHGGVKPRRGCRHHPRKFVVSAVCPLCGSRLRVEIEHCDLAASLNSSHSQGQGKGGFADAALFRYNGDYL